MAAGNTGRLDHVIYSHDTYGELAALGHALPTCGEVDRDAIDDLHYLVVRGMLHLGEYVLTVEQKATLDWVARHCRVGATEWSILSGIRHALAEALVKQHAETREKAAKYTTTFDLICRGEYVVEKELAQR